MIAEDSEQRPQHKGSCSLQRCMLGLYKAKLYTTRVLGLRTSTALYAALTATDQARLKGRREAPPGQVPVRRFSHAARWLRALLQGGPLALFDLERHVYAKPPPRATTSGWMIVTDASPWGGGAVLQHSDVAVQYTSWSWDTASAGSLPVKIGLPEFQSFWEFFTLGLAMALWCPEFPGQCLAILSDNTAALQDTLDLKGRGPMNQVALELAWRKARGRWTYEVGHWPSQKNVIADALSRLTAPDGKELPEALRDAARREPPRPADFWKL